MGVRKRQSHGGKPVKIRGLTLRVLAHVAHPIVEIVDGNEQDVGATRCVGRRLVVLEASVIVAAAHVGSRAILGTGSTSQCGRQHERRSEELHRAMSLYEEGLM